MQKKEQAQCLFFFCIFYQASNQGLSFPRGLFVGAGGEFGFPFDGCVSVIFELVIRVFICLLNSASLGIPGIGGVFFGRGLPPFFASVMPGIDTAEFDVLEFAELPIEMPGTDVVITVGVPENSGGILAEEPELDLTAVVLFASWLV